MTPDKCQILNKNTFTILGLILLLLGWSLEELGLETSRYDMIMPTVVKPKVNYMCYSVQFSVIADYVQEDQLILER